MGGMEQPPRPTVDPTEILGGESPPKVDVAAAEARNGEREFGSVVILAAALSPAAVPARCCDDRNPCSL